MDLSTVPGRFENNSKIIREIYRKKTIFFRYFFELFLGRVGSVYGPITFSLRAIGSSFLMFLHRRDLGIQYHLELFDESS